MLLIKKIKKYYEFIVTKVCLLWEEKKFHIDDVRLKYILQKADSHVLIVVFSSCTRKGLKARYNYRRTLNDFAANKLYILDDFAKDCRGSYYLGKHMSFEEERATHALIQNVIKECNCDTVICCGSSKGGWAALNFGLAYEKSVIIAGGPQYFLYDYLVSSNNTDALEHIVGNPSEEKREILNNYLKDRVINNKNKFGQKIYLHYSDKEHTYYEHIQYLLKDLENCGYNVECDVASYENHSDISFYYPDFLRKTIKDVIDKG